LFAGRPQGEPAAAERDEHAHESHQQWPKQPSGSLRREVEREAETEEPVERSDGAQIGAAGFRQARLGAEQPRPGALPQRRADADRFGHRNATAPPMNVTRNACS
jgi:hypothetical protein